MKKNGFTLVELIAVLVILSIISLLAAPNIVSLMQSGKQNSFISEVKEIISNATYMYKNEAVRATKFNQSEESGNYIYTIALKDVNGTIPEKDPYGYKYDKTSSYIKYKEPGDNSNSEIRTIEVYIKSCKENENNKCHCIISDNAGNLTTDNIQDCNQS